MFKSKKSRIFGGVLVAGAAAVFIPAAIALWTYATSPIDTVGELEFANELHIPRLLEPEIDAQGRKVFELAYQSGTTEFLDGQPTETIGLNGTFLAPVLRAERGDEVVVNVTNGLDESTTLHWHGMHLPAEMDGGPHQPITPGETWSPTWTIDQPAATLWFHPHYHELTEDHVYRGAAGMFIIDDAESAALDLPDEYGVDDIPVIVQDRAFNSDGSFAKRRPNFGNGGILGDELLVNGTYAPYFDASTSLVRLRLLNGSVARIYNFGFGDDREFSMIASDGGLLEAPVTLSRLQLSPGERAEIVVALEPGERINLRTFPANHGTNQFTTRFNGGDDVFDVLELRAMDALEPSPPLPLELVNIERWEPGAAAKTRRFDVAGTRINGREMDMFDPGEVVFAGTSEVWEVTGGGNGPHSFHVHDVQFLVLSINGQRPPPELSGWKDTIHLMNRDDYRLAVRFSDYASATSPYMFHCHILRHEDLGMMGSFVVVEPGQAVPERLPETHHQ